jgi:hypothetical protein
LKFLKNPEKLAKFSKYLKEVFKTLETAGKFSKSPKNCKMAIKIGK